jgi:SAM-dependent methyltransferase
MIDVLNSKLNDDQKKRITRQNIIDFKLNTTFDLIIAPFRVIMHLTDKVDQLKALNNIYAHLNPGGKFIFDAFVPDLGQLLNGIDNVTDFEGEYEPGKKIRRIVTSTPDLINQIILVRFNLEWEEEDNKRQEIWEVPLRFFFRYELEHLVERSDFRDYKITGDYLGNELNKTSRDFIITCIK